jgi:RND family efflux transporter MFP subunit
MKSIGPTVKKLAVLGLIILVVAAVGLKARSRLAAPPQDVSAKATIGFPVETSAVARESLTSRVSYSGTIVADQEATLSPKITGRIETLYVREGDRVEKGRTVAVLERGELESRAGTLGQRVNTARLNLEHWESELAAYDFLYQQGAIPRQQYEQIKFNRDTAQSTLAEVQSQHAEALVNLGYATITSPISGVVQSVLAQDGDLAMPGKPIVKIINPTALKAQFKVIESDLARIGPGTKVLLTLPGAVSGPVEASVSKVLPALDPVARSATVEVRIPSDVVKSLNLMPGMSAEASFILEEREDALVIPKKAVVEEKGSSYVYVVVDNKAVKKTVKKGIEDESKVEVPEGLEEGDLVITTGLNELYDGREVFLFGKEKADR